MLYNQQFSLPFLLQLYHIFSSYLCWLFSIFSISLSASISLFPALVHVLEADLRIMLSKLFCWLTCSWAQQQKALQGPWGAEEGDLRVCLSCSFAASFLRLLSWIPVAPSPLLVLSVPVLEEWLPFSLLPSSLNIFCLFLPLTLLSTLYIFLSCKSFELSGGEFHFMLRFALIQSFTLLLFKKLMTKSSGKAQSVQIAPSFISINLQGNYT